MLNLTQRSHAAKSSLFRLTYIEHIMHSKQCGLQQCLPNTRNISTGLLEMPLGKRRDPLQSTLHWLSHANGLLVTLNLLTGSLGGELNKTLSFCLNSMTQTNVPSHVSGHQLRQLIKLFNLAKKECSSRFLPLGNSEILTASGHQQYTKQGSWQAQMGTWGLRPTSDPCLSYQTNPVFSEMGEMLT